MVKSIPLVTNRFNSVALNQTDGVANYIQSDHLNVLKGTRFPYTTLSLLVIVCEIGIMEKRNNFLIRPKFKKKVAYELAA